REEDRGDESDPDEGGVDAKVVGPAAADAGEHLVGPAAAELLDSRGVHAVRHASMFARRAPRHIGERPGPNPETRLRENQVPAWAVRRYKVDHETRHARV